MRCIRHRAVDASVNNAVVVGPAVVGPVVVGPAVVGPALGASVDRAVGPPACRGCSCGPCCRPCRGWTLAWDLLSWAVGPAVGATVDRAVCPAVVTLPMVLLWTLLSWDLPWVLMWTCCRGPCSGCSCGLCRVHAIVGPVDRAVGPAVPCALLL